MFYVYILKSLKNGDLYIGSTNNLVRRMKEHNSGNGGHTKSYLPYKIAYYEAYGSEAEACHRESSLKHRRNAFSQLKRRIKESIGAN